jgi:hypothetical protein
VNVVEEDPAETVTEAAGTGSSVLLLAIDTIVPLAGAGLFSMTVHVVAPRESRLVGLHVRELNEFSTGACRLSVVVRGTPAGTAAEA